MVVVVAELELELEPSDVVARGRGVASTGAGGVTTPASDVNVTPAGRSAVMRLISVCQATSVVSSVRRFDSSEVI